jgi:hypothetical protein
LARPSLSVGAWRQISIGIAIKKFAGLSYLFELNSEQADTDDEGQDGVGGSTAAAFHWQASHTPRTGNRAYGGTINFQGGLTDGGLQEFRNSRNSTGLVRYGMSGRYDGHMLVTLVLRLSIKSHGFDGHTSYSGIFPYMYRIVLGHG